MMKVIPPTALRLQCPRCGEPVAGVETSAGWKVTTWEGTSVGNYRDDEPPRGERVEPFPAMTVYQLTPCGEDVSHPEVLALQAEADRQTAPAREAVAQERRESLAAAIHAITGSHDSIYGEDYDIADHLISLGYRR